MRNNRYVWPTFGSVVLLISALVVLQSPFSTHSHAGSSNVDDASQAIGQLSVMSDAFRVVAEKVQPSVVHIVVKKKPTMAARRMAPSQNMPEELRWFFGDRWSPFDSPFRHRSPGQAQRPQTSGHGSGWIYDGNGHIVTNHHVVKDADAITVKLSNKTEVDAKVVGVDPKTDIAVLRVDQTTPQAATLANKAVGTGEIVFAFGSPFQYEFSVSQGIVSGKGRRMGLLGPEGYENFIQTDAAINPGNSGGPLTNVRGEVVGMNTAIATTSGSFAGLGFAIPIDMVRPVVDQLIGTGKVTRGHLGAWISDDPKLLKSFGVDGPGVVVQDVMADGPAARAGLKAGDVLLEMDGRLLRGVSHLRNAIAKMEPGAKVRFKIHREGKSQSIHVTLQSQKTDTVTTSHNADGVMGQLGIEAATALTPDLAKRHGLPSDQGVLVRRVHPRSAAAMAGIRPGHGVTHVMDQPVTSVEEMVRQLKSHRLDEGVRLRVMTDEGRSMFVLISLNR